MRRRQASDGRRLRRRRRRRRPVLPGTDRRPAPPPSPAAPPSAAPAARDWRFDPGKAAPGGRTRVVRPSCDGKQSRVLAPYNGTSPSARRARARPGRLRAFVSTAVFSTPGGTRRLSGFREAGADRVRDGARTADRRRVCVCESFADRAAHTHDITHLHTFRPQIRRDYPPDLSILISGGKENNRDSPSSGERTGKSPSPNPAAHFCVAARMGVVAYGPASLPGRT